MATCDSQRTCDNRVSARPSRAPAVRRGGERRSAVCAHAPRPEPLGAPMRYMLLIHDEEKAWNDLPPAKIGAVMEQWGRFHAEIEGSGVMQSCARLKPAGTATLLRTSKGKARVTDGPYLEAKEQCGGYY